jgi:flagellar motility protein MotE (MotC chaperone)
VSRIPRLLPLVAVAIGGVLAVKALTEAPQLYLASRALAEDVVTKGPPKPALPLDASILSGQSSPPRPAAPACAPTAAELAKEAGLSPAELQVLQSLSDRRGQLDQRESGLDVQVQLIAAAEAKLDGRIEQMNGLKTDIQGLLGQADQQAQAEQDRLVHIYEDMDPKKAAAALAMMDDSVRLPIAAKMKERKLADILGKMDPADAKTLTEKLAARTAGSKVMADAKTALNPAATPTPAPAQAAAAAKSAKPDAVPADDDAQVGQTGPVPSKAGPAKPGPAKAAAGPAKPRKLARAAPAKPGPKAKSSGGADADVADAMNPPGGLVAPGAKPATPKAPAKVASAAPTKVASAARTPVGPASASPKPVAPPLPPSAKPG